MNYIFAMANVLFESHLQFIYVTPSTERHRISAGYLLWTILDCRVILRDMKNFSY
jgi:hypothetical protein